MKHSVCLHYHHCIQTKANGTPLQYSCLENPMDGGAWWATVHGVAKSRTWLGDFTFTFHFHALEKEMATHSSILAWRIPGTEEPGGLPSMGSHRVGHDWSDLSSSKNISVQANELEHVKNEESNIFFFIIEEWCRRRLLRVLWTATSPFWRRSALGFLWKEWC